MTRRHSSVLAIALAAVPLIASVAEPAQAQHRGFGRAPQPDHVVAHSRFGHGSVSGPVRQTRVGYEVRLPGGTWIPCGRSCSETLRVESVDFWENKGAGQGGRIDNECGILGCLQRRF